VPQVAACSTDSKRSSSRPCMSPIVTAHFQKLLTRPFGLHGCELKHSHLCHNQPPYARVAQKNLCKPKVRKIGRLRTQPGVDQPGNAAKLEITGRTPCCGIAKDTFSGSFDSPSVASSLRVAQEDRGIEFLSNYKAVENQTGPGKSSLPFFPAAVIVTFRSLLPLGPNVPHRRQV